MYNKLKNIIPHKIKIDNYLAKLLDEKDIPLIQEFFENNEDFFIMSTGNMPSNNTAEICFNNYLDGKTKDDKFFIGLLDNNNLIALIEIVQNYPLENEWTIYKYLLDKNYRGKGIATRLFDCLQDLLLTCKVKTLRVIVQEQNICGNALWNKLNFIEIGREKQEFFKDKDNIILSKKLEKKEQSIEEKFFKNGKLVNFPSKPSEQQEVYKIMIQWFEKNKKYTEPEINDIIKSKIECRDHATLRRDLVDNKLLNRSGDGKEYWV